MGRCFVARRLYRRAVSDWRLVCLLKFFFNHWVYKEQLDPGWISGYFRKPISGQGSSPSNPIHTRIVMPRPTITDHQSSLSFIWTNLLQSFLWLLKAKNHRNRTKPSRRGQQILDAGAIVRTALLYLIILVGKKRPPMVLFKPLSIKWFQNEWQPCSTN